MKTSSTLPLWDDLPVSLQVRSESGMFYFSREQLLKSLLPLNLPPGKTTEIAESIEQKLRSRDKKSVQSSVIRQIVIDELTTLVSQEAAETYAFWRDFRKRKQPFVVVIAGAPGVRLTDLALSLASKLDMQRCIDLDYIASVLIREDLDDSGRIAANGIDFSTGRTDDETTGIDEKTAVGQFEAAGVVMDNEVSHAISTSISGALHTVIYGSRVIPWLIDSRKYFPGAVVFPVSLTVAEKNDLESRGFRSSETLLNAAWTLNAHISKQSVRHNIPVVHDTGFDAAVSTLVRLCVRYARRRLGSEGVLEDSLETLRAILKEIHSP